MILARIARALKDQNWLAVGIEFVIVILGVVIGFQVTAWNADRASQVRADAYLDRILVDLQTDAHHFTIDRDFRLTVLASGEQALATTDATGRVGEDWQVVRAFWNASQMSGRPNINSTYVELTGAGELDLIVSSDLRGALTQYYTNTANVALNEVPAYRVHVRGMIPLAIQRYLWASCYEADGNVRQAFLDCPPPPGITEVSETAAALTGSAVLREELTFWMSAQDVAALVLDSRRGRALALADQIQAIRAGNDREANTP
ncbi:hypothetical protein [Maricaulis maris]|uniref:hypothetical protein n=1 Tax=Maricaulis maris TaxID=74318 RepID=UPI003B8ACBD5